MFQSIHQTSKDKENKVNKVADKNSPHVNSAHLLSGADLTAGRNNPHQPLAQLKGTDSEIQEKTDTALPAQKMLEEEKKPTQAKPVNASAQVGQAKTQQNVSKLSSPENKQGSDTSVTMPDAVQAKMEGSFSTNFSNVKIQQNSEQATQMGALAFTQGDNIQFAPGQYKPQSMSGQELLGHELTHVVQQRQGRVQSASAGTAPSQSKQVHAKGSAITNSTQVNKSSVLENEADTMGKKASRGEVANVGGRSVTSIQRKDGENEGLQNRLNKMDLKSEMNSAINGWYDNFNEGITDFQVQILKDKIFKLEQGSLQDFMVSILGNIIWASAAFASGGLAFGISLAGIGLSAANELANMSQSSRDSLFTKIVEAFRSYGDQIQTKLLDAAEAEVETILSESPEKYQNNVALHELMAKTFNSSTIDYGQNPPINKTFIYTNTLNHAKRMYYAFESIQKVTNNYNQKETYALPGVDKMQVGYERDFALNEYNHFEAGNKLELMTRHYGARMNYHLERPTYDHNWGDEIIHQSGGMVYNGMFGAPTLASTETYNFWFLNYISYLKNIKATELHKQGSHAEAINVLSPVRSNINLLKTTMNYVISKQSDLRSKIDPYGNQIIFNPQERGEYEVKAEIVHQRLLEQLSNLETLINGSVSDNGPEIMSLGA